MNTKSTLWQNIENLSNFHRFSNHISPIFFPILCWDLYRSAKAVWLISSSNPCASFEDTKENPRCPRYEIWDMALFFDSIPSLLRFSRGFQLEGSDAPRGSERGRWRREEINASASVRFTFSIPPYLLPSLSFRFSFSPSEFSSPSYTRQTTPCKKPLELILKSNRILSILIILCWTLFWYFIEKLTKYLKKYIINILSRVYI